MRHLPAAAGLRQTLSRRVRARHVRRTAVRRRHGKIRATMRQGVHRRDAEERRSAHHHLAAAGAGGSPCSRCAASAISPRPISPAMCRGASSPICASRCSTPSSGCPSPTLTATPAAHLLSRLTFNVEQIATTHHRLAGDAGARRIVQICCTIGIRDVPELPADRAGAGDGAVDGLAGVAHQPLLPALFASHPGFDGRCHARGQGELRGTAADQDLQRRSSTWGDSSARSTNTIRRSNMRLILTKGVSNPDRADHQLHWHGTGAGRWRSPRWCTGR